MTFQGTPPGHSAGDASRRTLALRPDIGLSVELTDAIRRERRKGAEPTAIAATLSLPLEVVERALLAMRTPRPERTRRNLSSTMECGDFVHRERREGEPIWKTLDRLVGELIELRRRVESAA